MVHNAHAMIAWNRKVVLVTGGASFLGSSLVDALIARGVRQMRVVDNLSSGKRDHLATHLKNGSVELVVADLLEPRVAEQAVSGVDVVFHLAADHGGRGYLEANESKCAGNLILDGNVFRTCAEANVEKVVFASSACVYPTRLQQDPSQELYLSEEMVGPPYQADNLYGWAKLMGELSLRAYYRERGLRSASCRYFTVYGPRANETHAILAMIARAFVKQDPFVVWGDGTQVRSWVYIDDAVEVTIQAAERIDDASAVNIGTRERVRILDAAKQIQRECGYAPGIELHPEMPTGPKNRAADNSLAARLLGWAPGVPFEEGLRRTIEWYFSAHDSELVKTNLDRILVEN